MDELRIGQTIIFPNKDLEGVVDKIEIDRVFVNYFERDKEKFKALQEGEVLMVQVKTSTGIKKMNSIIMDNKGEKLIIENAPSVPEPQNRQNVRTSAAIKLYVQANNTLYPAQTLDISAGGVKFELANNTHSLDNNSDIKIRIIDSRFKDELTLNAKIFKAVSEKVYVAQFENNSQSVLRVISSFCMGNID